MNPAERDGEFVAHSASQCPRLCKREVMWIRRYPPHTRHGCRTGVLAAHELTVAAIRVAFEKAGIEFIEENGGAGARLRKRQARKIPRE